MKLRLPAIILALVLTLIGQAAAALQIRNGSAPPDPRNVIDSVIPSSLTLINNAGCFSFVGCAGRGGPTVVELAAGGFIARGFGAFNNPRTIVSGSSRFNVSGGRYGDPPPRRGGIIGYDSHTAGLISGGVLHSFVELNGASTVTMTGGSVTGLMGLRLTPGIPDGIGPSLRIEGGEIGGLSGGIRVGGFGVVQMSGGLVHSNVSVSANGLVVISGGQFRDEDGLLHLSTQSDGVVEIIGRNFVFDGVPIEYGRVPAFERQATLRGVLASGEPLLIELGHVSGEPPSNIFVLPEPTPILDSDGDGVFDRHDFCPYFANPNNPDTDLNYIGDDCNDFEDRDGDEHADDLDVCPDTPDPMQRDRDRNGIGNLCNDEFDRDGDEFEDDIDTCPDLNSGNQSDEDHDGVGDLCDPFPEDRLNIGAIDELFSARSEIISLVSQRDEATQELFQCLADPPFRDRDADGEHDRTDACPNTSASLAVDASGCSLSQFCEAVGSLKPGDARSCNQADWLNDESRRRPFDCNFTKRAGQPSCVACLNKKGPCGQGAYKWKWNWKTK